MYCSNCGTENENSKFCKFCGKDLAQQSPTTVSKDDIQSVSPSKTSKVMGIISMILGISSASVTTLLFWFPYSICVAPNAIAGLILGVLSLQKNKKDFPNGHAKAGIILSAVSLVTLAIVIIFWIVLFFFAYLDGAFD